MAGDKLTIKQEKYAQGLFAGLSQREAYKQAYNCDNMSDKSIDENACRLAADIKVVSRIEELKMRLQERNMVTVENVLSELSKIAFDDIKNYLRFYPDADGNIKMEIKDSETIDTRAISEVSLGKDGQFKFKQYCKDNALVQLGKHLGLFTDNIKLSGGTNNTNTEIDVDLFNSKATEEEKKNAANLSGAEILAIMSRN
jgi:phage terminase small subunit